MGELSLCRVVLDLGVAADGTTTMSTNNDKSGEGKEEADIRSQVETGTLAAKKWSFARSRPSILNSGISCHTSSTVSEAALPPRPVSTPRGYSGDHADLLRAMRSCILWSPVRNACCNTVYSWPTRLCTAMFRCNSPPPVCHQ